MQGNRATQTSGPVRALCFFSLRGVDGRDGLLLLFQLFTCLFPFIPPHQPCTTLSKVFLPPTTAPRPSHGTGIPSCLRSSAQFACCLSLCKCVLAIFPPAHTARNPPLICNSLPCTFKLIPSVGLSFLERNGRSFPHLTLFWRGKHLRHAHDPSAIALFIYHQRHYGCNAMRSPPRDEADDIDKERDGGRWSG